MVERTRGYAALELRPHGVHSPINVRKEFCFKNLKNMIVQRNILQYNILKIFIMHFSKINQTYFILYCSFINE